MIKLSHTQAVILSAAAQHPRGLVTPPAKLAPAPRDAVRKSLLAKGLMAPTVVLRPDRVEAVRAVPRASLTFPLAAWASTDPRVPNRLP